MAECTFNWKLRLVVQVSPNLFWNQTSKNNWKAGKQNRFPINPPSEIEIVFFILPKQNESTLYLNRWKWHRDPSEGVSCQKLSVSLAWAMLRLTCNTTGSLGVRGSVRMSCSFFSPTHPDSHTASTSLGCLRWLCYQQRSAASWCCSDANVTNSSSGPSVTAALTVVLMRV